MLTPDAAHDRNKRALISEHSARLVLGLTSIIVFALNYDGYPVTQNPMSKTYSL